MARGAGRGRGRGGGRGASGTPGRGFATVADEEHKTGKHKGSAKQARSGGSSNDGRPRRPLADLLDYLRSCQRSLAGPDASPQDEELLSSRALEEIGDRVLLVAADQRGSRTLERLLRPASLDAFAPLFARLVEALPELAPNQYGSHVLEAVLACWAERQSKSPEAAASLTPPLVALCSGLQESGALQSLVTDACATHAVRLLLLALGGYSTDLQGKGRADVRAGLLPERRHDVQPEVTQQRRALCACVVSALEEDAGLCLSAHASPVVQLVMRLHRASGERGRLEKLTRIVVGGPAESDRPSVERCDVLLHSAAGSRVLEAALETGAANLVGALFSGFFRPRLRSLVAGEPEYGLPLAQRVAECLCDEPQLRLALKEVDFSVCLAKESNAAQHIVVAKLLESCLRFGACLKEASAEVFRALGLRASAEYHRSWPTLLMLEHADSPLAMLLEKKNAKSGEGDAGADAAASESSRPKAVPAKLRTRSCAGAQILGILLRFPAEMARPLNDGLPKLLEHRTVLAAMAREARTARVLEAALASSSALLPKRRLLLAKAFKGLLGELGPHPVGGWVCAAVWRASLGDEPLRKVFAEELLAVEEALRKDNFAVWKVCGLHQVKVRREEWEQSQKKASKTKRFFDEILEGSDPEAAKAAKAARERAAMQAREEQVLADPLVQGLLPVPAEQDAGDAGEGSAAPTAEAGATSEVNGDADADLDGHFAKAGRGKKRRRSKTVAQAQEPSAASLDVKVPTDESLSEALRLIAAGSTKRGRRKKGRS